MTREAAACVQDDRVVTLEYTLTGGDGATLGGATSKDPLVYLHGRGAIPKALEAAIDGRGVSERFEVELSPEEFVGPRLDDAARAIPIDALPDDPTPTVGMQLEVAEDDQTFPVWVTDVGKSHLKVSLEHPWAGRSVTLVAKILMVRPATPEELESGEPIGPQPVHAD